MELKAFFTEGGSQKTPEEFVVGESDLEQQDASFSQFSAAKSIESVFSGASSFSASESQPPRVLITSFEKVLPGPSASNAATSVEENSAETTGATCDLLAVTVDSAERAEAP
ncbi:brain acid soluble protein 1-like [Artemia franciscana]|uniref:brain acid soluble protein 1-like n=1 Tax=Artemia franciscana TaxID=6661 RepID=UPI0032DA5867